MNGTFSTDRVFALSAFEGVRLIRIYAAKHQGCPLTELLTIIEHVEADAGNLDLSAAAYLDGLVAENCPLDGYGFYQACITAVVTRHQPNWGKAMKQGRLRFLDSLAQDDRDVFAAAGLLLKPIPLAVVQWWGSIAGYTRMLDELEVMQRAREAEALSLDHERKRLAEIDIDKEPEWKGLDDNWAGFDILSYDLGEHGPINRMIEVKSTISSPLRFILTRNEWEKAKDFGPAYHFHVWDMQKTPPVLYQRTIAQVSAQIPTDNEKGKWKTAEIPLGAI